MSRKVSVIDYLEENYLNIPDKTAVSEESESITWLELRNRSRELAYSLISTSDPSGKKVPVVIFMDRSISHVVSIYGTLYSGSFYVPVDVSTPVERLNSILETLQEYRILTNRKDEKKLLKSGYSGEYLVYEDLIGKAVGKAESPEIHAAVNSIMDSSLMYIIFTSGSTGVPKGVAVRHRSVMDYISSFMDEVGMRGDDVCGNQAPFYSDMSLKDLYMTLASGAELCIIPAKCFSFPLKLLQYIDEKKITYCMWVPTVYRIIAQFKSLGKLRPDSIRTLCFSGESMQLPVFEYWKGFYPDIDYWQFYGPSEITGSCSYYKVDNKRNYDGLIPIGKPYRNTGMILVDGEEIIPQSDRSRKGEICVYGTCLAAGYYNNPEKTEMAFTDLPSELGYGEKMYHTGDLAFWDEDGNLVFSGRMDYQVKHMGKRIELGEIENAVDSLDDIDACCCVHNKNKDALVLYYIGSLSEKDLMRALDSKLPPYMIPTVVNKVETLPQLPNGKLDRKTLEKENN
ncbi:amino acid adenylation domain-containing protein [Lachnospiraceae bacterium]|nr:amino acid adenylation domain-containing protein [Lachnospiraceae bacterium]